jgi:hypothetical protein
MFNREIIKKLSFCLLFLFLIMNSENFSYKFNVPFFNSQIFYERNDVKKINNKNDQIALMSGLQTGELKYEVLEMVYEILNKVYKKQGLRGGILDEEIQKFYKYLGKVSEIKIDTNEYSVNIDTDQRLRTIIIQFNGKQYKHKIIIDKKGSKVRVFRGEFYPKNGLILNGIYFLPELLKIVFRNLPTISLGICAHVCKTWFYLSRANRLWEYRLWEYRCIIWCRKTHIAIEYLYGAVKIYNNNFAKLYQVLGKIPVTKARYEQLVKRVFALLETNIDSNDFSKVITPLLFLNADWANWKDIVYIFAYIFSRVTDRVCLNVIVTHIEELIENLKYTENKKNLFEILNVFIILKNKKRGMNYMNSKLSTLIEISTTKNQEIGINGLAGILLIGNFFQRTVSKRDTVMDGLSRIAGDAIEPEIFMEGIRRLNTLYTNIKDDEHIIKAFGYVISSGRSLEIKNFFIKKLENMFKNNLFRDEIIFEYIRIIETSSSIDIKQLGITALQNLFSIVNNKYDLQFEILYRLRDVIVNGAKDLCFSEEFKKNIITQYNKNVVAEIEDVNNELFVLYREEIEAEKEINFSGKKIQKEKLIMLSDGRVIYCFTTEDGKEIRKILIQPMEYNVPINNFRRINSLISNILLEIFDGKVNRKIQDLIFKTLSKQDYDTLLNQEVIKNIVVAS